MMSHPNLRKFGRELLHLIVNDRTGLEAYRAEDGHAIVLARGAAETRQLINDLPQTGHCAFEEFDGRVFVAKTNDVGLSKRWFLLAHVVVGGVGQLSVCLFSTGGIGCGMWVASPLQGDEEGEGSR